jgi:hypothetical protein
MKTFLTFFFVAVIAFNSQSQSKTRKYEYAIVTEDEFGKDKLMIYYGDGRKEDFAELKKIKLESGNNNNMNNVTDALNYMDEQGYELVSSTMTTISLYGTPSYYQYVFRRETKNK